MTPTSTTTPTEAEHTEVIPASICLTIDTEGLDPAEVQTLRRAMLEEFQHQVRSGNWRENLADHPDVTDEMLEATTSITFALHGDEFEAGDDWDDEDSDDEDSEHGGL